MYIVFFASSHWMHSFSPWKMYVCEVTIFHDKNKESIIHNSNRDPGILKCKTTISAPKVKKKLQGLFMVIVGVVYTIICTKYMKKVVHKTFQYICLTFNKDPLSYRSKLYAFEFFWYGRRLHSARTHYYTDTLSRLCTSKKFSGGVLFQF